MKKLWYVVIAVAVVYLGWEFFRPRPGEMQSQTGTASVIDALSGAPVAPSTEETLPASVMYSTTGFSPASVTVKKGTAVMWTNISSGGMRVAATSGLPANNCAEGAPASFDQCVASAAGSQWSFVFNEVGTWKYHNADKKEFGGTVIVTE